MVKLACKYEILKHLHYLKTVQRQTTKKLSRHILYEFRWSLNGSVGLGVVGGIYGDPGMFPPPLPTIKIAQTIQVVLLLVQIRP